LNYCQSLFSYKNSFSLESGRVLDGFEIIYSTYGTLNNNKSNVILVCHPLALDHKPVLVDSAKKGWWNDLIGSKKAIDTDKYFVICTNVIGSNYGSTSPSSINPQTNKIYNLSFPVITVKAMINAQKLLLDDFGIISLKAIVGGSMGAMQALEFAVNYPNISENIIALAVTSKTRDHTIAFNRVIQESILNDKDFNNGNYDREKISEKGFNGLCIARMLGHITFLSPYSMQEKFKNEYVNNDGIYDLFGRFQVESYLKYNGENFSKRFDPNCYLYLSKAINIFDISRGYESLSDAISKIKSNLYTISFSGDMLFFPYEMEYLKLECDKVGITNNYTNIKSSYGHDAFLVEVEKFEHIIKDALK
jgi:homoserine O-acetyltransferase